MALKQGDTFQQGGIIWSQAVFDAVPAAIAVVGGAPPHPVLAVNLEFCRVVCLDAAAIIGAPVVRLIAPETSDDAAAALAAALDDCRPVDLDLELAGGDGRTRSVEAHVRPLEQDGARALVATVVDMTGQRGRERDLRTAWEESERAMRGKMRFFAAASHDLRQPLQALALFVAALGSHVHGEAATAILQAIKASLRSMEDMFDSLLDMSRLDAGVLKAQPAEFLIGDIMEKLEVEFRQQCESRGLDLRVVPSSAQVISDPRLLARILRNFMSNAVRYTPGGRILLGCRRRGEVLRIEVWDTGPGIPEHQRLAIFDEFYRADSGASSGLGLGLAIVQRLARLLRHRLDVCCVEGRGTMFAVEVPRADLAEAEPDADGEVMDDDAESKGPDMAGVVVAVVEDDRDVLGGLVMILEEWGCRVAGAATASEVVSSLTVNGQRPDVILADLHLRHQDSGLSAIRALREVAGRDVPAFVFTGDTDPRTDSDLPYPVLRKPINPIRLREVLGEALGRIS